MRIIGIGVDVVNPARVLRLYNKFGTRFLDRAFHPSEVSHALELKSTHLGTFLSSRWAAKEALHKAIGTKRFLFPDIEVFRDEAKGPPSLRLHNEAARYQHLHGLGFLVTLSHEENLSIAFVVASKK